MRNPLFISFFLGANMSSVTGIGLSSSGRTAATMAPLAGSEDTQTCSRAGAGTVGATTGFKSACCTWCAANTSSLHSIPLRTKHKTIAKKAIFYNNMVLHLFHGLAFRKANGLSIYNIFLTQI